MKTTTIFIGPDNIRKTLSSICKVSFMKTYPMSKLKDVDIGKDSIVFVATQRGRRLGPLPKKLRRAAQLYRISYPEGVTTNTFEIFSRVIRLYKYLPEKGEWEPFSLFDLSSLNLYRHVSPMTPLERIRNKVRGFLKNEVSLGEV